MKTATITHDVNGIRMNIDGTVHHWANQSWLAESHAQMMIRAQWLDAKIKDIREIIAAMKQEPSVEIDQILAVLNRD